MARPCYFCKNGVHASESVICPKCRSWSCYGCTENVFLRTASFPCINEKCDFMHNRSIRFRFSKHFSEFFSDVEAHWVFDNEMLTRQGQYSNVKKMYAEFRDIVKRQLPNSKSKSRQNILIEKSRKLMEKIFDETGYARTSVPFAKQESGGYMFLQSDPSDCELDAFFKTPAISIAYRDLFVRSLGRAKVLAVLEYIMTGTEAAKLNAKKAAYYYYIAKESTPEIDEVVKTLSQYRNAKQGDKVFIINDFNTRVRGIFLRERVHDMIFKIEGPCVKIRLSDESPIHRSVLI